MVYLGALGAMSTHGTVGLFIPGREDWVLYTECQQHYFAANVVDSATKQCTILLSSCGANTYQVIHNLVASYKVKRQVLQADHGSGESALLPATFGDCTMFCL